MVKRGLLILALAVFAVTGVFAQIAFSAGLGAYFSGDFGGGVKVEQPGFGETGYKLPYSGGGGFLFIDATYFEASLGVYMGGGNWESKGYDEVHRPITEKYDVSGSAIDLGLMVKYPFSVSERIAVFPLAGINYRAQSYAEMDDVEISNPEDISALWFKFGGGLDYSLSDTYFLRAEVLYGLRLKNRFEKDLINDTKADVAYEGINGVDITGRRGHGLDIKLAVGHRF